jgi:hypothetical protein
MGPVKKFPRIHKRSGKFMKIILLTIVGIPGTVPVCLQQVQTTRSHDESQKTYEPFPGKGSPQTMKMAGIK